MKITFPHMGSLYIVLKTIFEELGTEVILPPKCSKRTLELGTKYSPELICVPFKITVGNYIESIEQGADTLFMWSGCDVCRIGFYNTLQKDILRDLGYDFQMITIEPMYTKDDIFDFMKKLKLVSNQASYMKILATFRRGLKILFEVDAFDDLINQKRAREIYVGDVDQLYSRFEEDIKRVKGYKETYKLLQMYRQELERIPVDRNRDVLRIGIVGEIYTVVEPFINLDLIKKLGSMGVEIHRSVTSSEFLREQIDFIPFIHSDKKEVHRAAAPYLDTEIGGHARHTVGNSALYGERNYDGVIHLLPFTCMPEIVAQSILPTVEKDKNIPILKLVLDEMTGEAGYQTRLEAFVDLLRKRRETNTHEKVLSWH